MSTSDKTPDPTSQNGTPTAPSSTWDPAAFEAPDFYDLDALLPELKVIAKYGIGLDAIDAVVVPAFGAGRNGHRIGHGHGFYDAFLSEVDVPRICLIYHETLVPVVPAEAHDVRMTHLVTERETVAGFD